MERRIGHFIVSEKVIRNDNLDMAKALFAGMVPVRVEARYDMLAFDVMAICDDFDLVPVGVEVPPYKIYMEREEAEDGTVTWKRGTIQKGELL